LISQGVMISMQEFIEVFPGSAIHGDILNGTRKMDTISDNVMIPATGNYIASNVRVLPNDPNMRALVFEFYSELSRVNAYLIKQLIGCK